MSFTATDIVATLLLNLIHCSYAADHILSCNVTALEPCPGYNQICNETSHQCECMPGFSRYEEHCYEPDDMPTAHHTTAVLVTIFTLALLICGLVLVVRKYNLIEYVRQKINLRRNNDIMYEDVMIGQDDPPLSP
uniref:EGF-like domain-containing protein n=1 Tax=Pectinophora gossypiella TaxID=13191 RepID=A0A1E1W005_PECGO